MSRSEYFRLLTKYSIYKQSCITAFHVRIDPGYFCRFVFELMQSEMNVEFAGIKERMSLRAIAQEFCRQRGFDVSKSDGSTGGAVAPGPVLVATEDICEC